MYNHPIPTSIVGSYPQPAWLVDREKLLSRLPPRVRDREVWRVAPELLQDAQDDATLIAIRDQERAGLDIVTDGEVRRESYSNKLATALGGVDVDNPGTTVDRIGKTIPVPRITGPIRRDGPIMKRDAAFLSANTDRLTKITLPGPFTMAQQAQDDHYGDEEALALAYAEVLREEVRDIFEAGVDIVQLDEPYMQARPEKARQYAIKAINRVLEDAPGRTAVHMCFGYAYVVHEKPNGYSFLRELDDCAADEISIEVAQPKLDLSVIDGMTKTFLIGVLDMGDPKAEDAETVAERLRRALEHLPADRVIAAPDCGMKYLDREVAFGKLQALAKGAEMVRREAA